MTALFSQKTSGSDAGRMETHNSDPVRNYKNYMIIENTLYRKLLNQP